MITLDRAPPGRPASSPDEVLARLLDGNRRVQSMGIRRRGFAGYTLPDLTPAPDVAVLACAGAPASPGLLFDLGADLFTLRVPGPTVTPETLEDLAYAVRVLRVSLIVVLGHEGCPSLVARSGSLSVEEHVLEQVRRVRAGLGTPAAADVELVGAVLHAASLSIRVVGGD